MLKHCQTKNLWCINCKSFVQSERITGLNCRSRVFDHANTSSTYNPFTIFQPYLQSHAIARQHQEKETCLSASDMRPTASPLGILLKSTQAVDARVGCTVHDSSFVWWRSQSRRVTETQLVQIFRELPFVSFKYWWTELPNQSRGTLWLNLLVAANPTQFSELGHFIQFTLFAQIIRSWVIYFIQRLVATAHVATALIQLNAHSTDQKLDLC